MSMQKLIILLNKTFLWQFVSIKSLAKNIAEKIKQLHIKRSRKLDVKQNSTQTYQKHQLKLVPNILYKRDEDIHFLNDLLLCFQLSKRPKRSRE